MRDLSLSSRSPEEQDLVERAFRALPAGTLGNVTMPFYQAFVVKEARGSRIYDHSGREYIDYLLGSGPLVLGHAHPAVNQAVKDALDRGSTYFLTSGPAIELAEEIVRAVPCAEQVRFTVTGTDATFQCLRIARAYRRREKVLKFEGGFHGGHDYSMVSLAPRPGQLGEFPRGVPSSAGIPKAVAETVLVAPFNDASAATAIIDQHADELAAVIVEPFQRTLAPVEGFLQALREATTRHGVPLIFDEVVTGFRLAYGGAQEYYGVVPDLAALGKIIGGGFPLGAVAGRADFMRHYDASAVAPEDFVPQTSTLAGNPIACVAGLATLAELRKPRQYQRLHDTGRALIAGLHDALAAAEVPHQFGGEPVCVEVYFTAEPVRDYRDTLKADTTLAARFARGLLERGVLKGGQKFYVSLAHTEEDVATTVQAAREVARELRR